MTDVNVRALRPTDMVAARALVSAQFGGTPYEARLLVQLALATSGDDPECRVLVSDDEPRALVLYGSIAGAMGVVKIYALAGNAIASRSLVAAVRDTDTRLFVCEVAEDMPFAVTTRILRESGFEEAGRVADYFREGVALVVLTWRSQ
ncbi:MAG: hypothetical protein ABI664_11430 [bacterium]